MLNDRDRIEILYQVIAAAKEADIDRLSVKTEDLGYFISKYYNLRNRMVRAEEQNVKLKKTLRDQNAKT